MENDMSIDYYTSDSCTVDCENPDQRKTIWVKKKTQAGVIDDKNNDMQFVPYTIVNQCNEVPHAKCLQQGVKGAKVYIDGELNGTTDDSGFIILKGNKIIGKVLTVKHEIYTPSQGIQINRWGKNVIVMHFDRNKLRKTINKALSIAAREDWSSKEYSTKDHSEDWCYSIITIHHAGDGDIKTPADIEEKHLGEKCNYCDYIPGVSGPNGWSDIGYHYFIDKSGKIYEARAIGYKGVHVSKNNSYKIGINLLGDYNSEGILTSKHDVLPKEQIQACINLVNELKKYFPLIELGGHRDYALNPDAACPGNILYDKLDELRKATNLLKPTMFHKQHAKIKYKDCE